MGTIPKGNPTDRFADREQADDAIGRLRAGESWERSFRNSSLNLKEQILAVGLAGLEGSGPGRPSLVQEPPLCPRIRETLSARSLSELAPGASETAALALSAGLLLIHEFWDASHTAAQRADDLGERAVSAYWHGIAHRMEPDPGNASYWFRRVGKHSIFPQLADYARTRLAETPGLEPTATSRLLDGGSWNPFAMIELCGKVKTGSPAEAMALDLQREEMRLLLLATLDHLAD